MKTELKKAIVDYIIDNVNVWNRLNHTTDHFREYIYNSEGNFLIGGEDVYNRICEIDKLF